MRPHRSRRPLGSELQPLLHMEALSAGEASLFAVQTAPTLSVAAFGIMITKSYVTTFCGGLQAGRADFAQVSGFDLQFWLCHVIFSAALCMEGGYTRMGWNGCVFFKKGNP